MLVGGNYICSGGVKWCNKCEHWDDCPDGKQSPDLESRAVPMEDYDTAFDTDE